MHGRSVLRIGGWVLLGVAGAAALGLVLGLAIMWLWNWLMPGIFGLPEITYWQAVGIFILCHLLFKGHTGHGHGPKGERERFPFGPGARTGHVRERLRDHFRDRMPGTWGDEERAAGE